MEQQSNNAAKTISVVMLVTLLGKVMGLYRDRLLAVHYSVGVQANAFFTASRIPRVFFDAVFASAIAACFIPVFSEFLEKKGRKEAFRFAGNFITVMALLCPRRIGQNQWVLTKSSEVWNRVYAHGELVQAETSLTLKEYVAEVNT